MEKHTKMLTINLACEEESEIGYKKILYPDNQVSIALDNLELSHYGDGPITIKSRFNTYEDLMYLLGVLDVLHHSHTSGLREVHVYIPCFLGQRSDRRFNEAQSNDLGIIADIIKGQNISSLTIMHTHSDVLPMLFERDLRMVRQTNSKLITFMMKCLGRSKETKNLVFVSPDAGAYKTVHGIGEALTLPVVPANKVRTEAGIIIEVSGDVKDKTCAVVDDYCDGGMTFIKLARRLKELGATKVILCSTHFLGSKGLDPILEVVDMIFTTNSIKDIVHDRVEQLKVI